MALLPSSSSCRRRTSLVPIPSPAPPGGLHTPPSLCETRLKTILDYAELDELEDILSRCLPPGLFPDVLRMVINNRMSAFAVRLILKVRSIGLDDQFGFEM